MIPRLIHQTWKSAEVPAIWRSAVASWPRHHTDWEHRIWTDERAAEFIAEHFCEYKALYRGYPYGIQRADFFRLAVLFKFGGVYADMDLECLAPLDHLIGETRLVLAREPASHRLGRTRAPPCNAFLAAPPGHPHLARLLEHLAEQGPVGMSHADVLTTTGPWMLARVLETLDQNQLRILDSQAVYPLAVPRDNAALADLQLRQDEPATRQLRQRLIRAGSFAVHYWSNSWCDGLAGELVNDQPDRIPGFVFVPGWDAPRCDLRNGGRDIAKLAEACSGQVDAAGFNTDGFVKSAAILRRPWRRLRQARWNEGLYLSTARLSGGTRLIWGVLAQVGLRPWPPRG